MPVSYTHLDVYKRQVNISLDTLDKEKYKQVTGFDKLSVVLASITTAVESGIPVKINAVLQKGMNEEEWLLSLIHS